MQIRPVEVELFHVEGRTDRQTGRQAGRWTDMTKLIVIFRNFSKAPKNCFNVRYCAATDEVMWWQRTFAVIASRQCADRLQPPGYLETAAVLSIEIKETLQRQGRKWLKSRSISHKNLKNLANWQGMLWQRLQRIPARIKFRFISSKYKYFYLHK